MIRHLRSVVVAALVLGMSALPVFADRSGDQGLGVMFGNPTGFSYKMFIDNRVAVDGAFGVAQSELDAHITLLFHDFELLRRSPAFSNFNGDVPLYFGVGPRVLFDEDTEFGVRLPIGMAFLPGGTPWEFFVEIAPVIRFTPDTGGDLDFALGARYYFPAIRPRAN